MIVENAPQKEKLTLFLDYYFQQSMENQNVSIEMWNINKHRHRINNAIEGWNSKLNCIMWKQQPNVVLPVQKLDEETELVSWQLQCKHTGEPGRKRRT